jgi:hypothetical protein
VSELQAYVLCRFADNSGVYSSWIDEAPLPVNVIDEFLPDWHVPDDAGILITHMHYRWEELTTLRKVLAQNRIPILILSDGILEYRNTWEHPDLVEGSIFQPLFGHKLACIGRGQARVVESWGNPGKCEVVGLPRLDDVDPANVKPVQDSGPFRVLIATANTPAFDDHQRASVVEALNQIKKWISANASVAGRPIEVHWRLSDGLESEIGVGDDIDPEERPPLGGVLENVDAVITTPSTLYLESILRRRPTAILDFYNSPHYISPAWTINAPRHLDWIMPELAAPPKHKMMFQEFVLEDQLECRTPAKPRMLELIRTLVEAGKQARRDREELRLPARVLADPQRGFVSVPASFELSNLYSNQEALANQDLHRLQIELVAAIKRLEQLPYELAEKNQYIAQLKRSLDRSRVRVEDMHNRVVAIRKRFGVEPSTPNVEGRDIVDDE